MSDETIISLRFNVAGNPSATIAGMSQAARELARTEGQFESEVQKAVKALQRKEQVSRAMLEAQKRLGLAVSEERSFESEVQKVVKAIQQKEKATLAVVEAQKRLGLAVTEEQKYQQEVQKTIKALEHKARVQADVEKHFAQKGLNAQGQPFDAQEVKTPETFAQRADRLIAQREEDARFKKYMNQRGFDSSGNPLRSGLEKLNPAQVIHGLASGNPMALASVVPQAALIAAVVMAVTKALDAAGKVAEIYAHGRLTEAQKFRAAADELIPGAGKFYSLIEASSGTTEGLRRGEELRDRKQLLQQQNAAIRGREFDLGMQLAGAQARQTAVTQVPIPGLPVFDRGTAAGRVAAQEAELRQPFREATARAEQAVVAAREQAKYSDQEVEAAKKRLAIADKEAAIASDRFKKTQEAENGMPREWLATPALRHLRHLGRALNPLFGADATEWAVKAAERAAGGQVESAAAGHDAQLAAANRTLAAEAHRRAVEAQAKSKADVAAAEGEAVKARTAERLRGEMAYGQSQLSLRESQYERLGQMSQGQQARGVAAVRAVKAMGEQSWDRAPAALREALASVAPAMARDLNLKSGERGFAARELKGLLTDAEYRENFGGRKDESLRQMREQQNKLQLDLNAQVNLDNKEVARLMTEALKQQLQGLVESVKVEMRNRMAELVEGQATAFTGKK